MLGLFKRPLKKHLRTRRGEQALDATVSGPRHPGRGVREWDLKINKEAGTLGRAGSPLHAESAAPTGVVALPEDRRLTQPPLQQRRRARRSRPTRN